MRLYEGMYIVSKDLAATGSDKVEALIRETVSRFGGEIVRLREWGERQLAYPIEKQVRGVYVLTQFRLDPASVVKLESRIQIMPEILRVLVTCLDEKYAEESFAKDPGDENLRLDSDEGDDDDRDRFRRRRDEAGDDDRPYRPRRRNADADGGGRAVPADDGAQA